MPHVKRVDKLIARQVLSAVLVVWLVLVGFDTVLHFARELGDLGKDGYSLAQAVLYIAMTVPRRGYEMFGHAALIGGLLGLGALAATSELTALRASGMSRARIVASVLVTMAVLTVAVVALGETAAPAGEQHAQSFKLSLRSSKLGMATRSGLWARDGDAVINAKGARVVRHGDSKQVQLADVRIYGLNKKGALTSFTLAGTAMSQPGAWQLHDVRITHFDSDGAHSRKRDRMPWQSNLDARVLELSIVRPKYMSLRELQRNIHYFRANDQNPQSYVNAWWARVFYPLTVLLLVLAVLPLAFGNLRSGGAGKRIFLGIILAVTWYFLQMALVSVGNVYGLPAWLANLIPALLLAPVAAVFYRCTA